MPYMIAWVFVMICLQKITVSLTGIDQHIQLELCTAEAQPPLPSSLYGKRSHAGRSEGAEAPQAPTADPFAHCAAHPELTPRPDVRSVSRAEAATVPRLQPEDFASPLQSGLRYGIMSHISAQTGFSPGSSQQVHKTACVLVDKIQVCLFEGLVSCNVCAVCNTVRGPGCSVVEVAVLHIGVSMVRNACAQKEVTLLNPSARPCCL